jgi:hypothetical protein
MATLRFPFRLGRRSRAVLRLFGVRGPADAWVELGDEDLEARFGRMGVTTPVANIASWRIEGPWRWITAIGVRRSIRHADFTFAGTNRGGVRLDFVKPVRIAIFDAPALYVTVEDLEGLADALTARGIAGVDARTRIEP